MVLELFGGLRDGFGGLGDGAEEFQRFLASGQAWRFLPSQADILEDQTHNRPNQIFNYNFVVDQPSPLPLLTLMTTRPSLININALLISVDMGQESIDTPINRAFTPLVAALRCAHLYIVPPFFFLFIFFLDFVFIFLILGSCKVSCYIITYYAHLKLIKIIP